MKKNLKGTGKNSLWWGVVANKHPLYAGRKLCEACRNELMHTPPNPQTSIPFLSITKLGVELNKAIPWLKDEVMVDNIKCKEFFEDDSYRTNINLPVVGAINLGGKAGKDGHLILTNQRILFVCMVGMLSSEYALIYSINLEDIVAASHGRFGLNDKLIILDKHGQHRDFIQPKIHAIIPNINKVMMDRKNYVQAQKEKEHIQIVLDFSSLKDIMSKGGIVMTRFMLTLRNLLTEF